LSICTLHKPTIKYSLPTHISTQQNRHDQNNM
jgi:hypothetical protein